MQFTISHRAFSIIARASNTAVCTAGEGSCGPGPGSYDHYQLDAETFANDWHADYLKVDFCGKQVSRDSDPQYTSWSALRDALNATGRPIYYSICPHTPAPANGPAKLYHGASVHSPPAAWTGADFRALANSILVEFNNNFGEHVRTLSVFE